MDSKLKKTGAMTVTLDGQSTELPVFEGAMGPKVVDFRAFYKSTGAFTFDPGFTSTASCESQITFIDGDEGVLLYRGVPIDDLAEHSDFLEVAYLLLHGDLPDADEKSTFENAITMHTMVHEQLKNFYNGFRRDAHPMAIMVGVVGALSAFYHDSTDINDPEQRKIASHRMIAKMPTIAAMAYKYSIGQPFVFPRNDLDYTSNFMRMCFAVPAEEFECNKVLCDALDKIFILHMDHEQNASTSTVRLAGSGMFGSGSDRLQPAFAAPLAKVAQALNETEGPIIIMGHSDNIPIRSSRFASNMHLSLARAESVMRTLAGEIDDSDRLKAEGRADKEPIAPNDTREGRAKNRRIEIVLVREDAS